MMIPSSISRGPQGRVDVPVWMVAAGAAVVVVVLFMLYVLFTMGSAPTVTEVTGEVPVHQ